MRKLLLCLLTLLSASTIYGAPFLNPGIYVGWEFGEKRGLVLGAEISTGFANDGHLYGVDYNFHYNLRSKNHKNIIEGEIGSVLGGVTLGYEINSVYANSPRASIWAGAFGYAVVSYAPKSENAIGVGLLGKVPLITDKNQYNNSDGEFDLHMDFK